MERVDGYLSIHRGGLIMNKKEFLSELEKRLSGLPKEDIQDRLAFYEEAIDDRVEEGKTEEEAIEDIGSLDDVVWEIYKGTPLVTLVKEKVKPKRTIKAWEIVLLALGFPIWFPLVLTALVLILVAYILVWVLVIVCYSVELSTIVSAVGGVIGFFAMLGTGTFHLGFLSLAIMCAGFSILFVFACIGATKLTLRITKNIILSIKKKLVRGK